MLQILYLENQIVITNIAGSLLIYFYFLIKFYTFNENGSANVIRLWRSVLLECPILK
jgi:hypothetical protein